MQYTWRNRTRTFFNQMRSRIRRRPQGIDPERTALVLCGTRELNPVTVGILRHFPKFTYVFAGKEGKNCAANLRAPQWWTRCYGTQSFKMVIMEYCPTFIHQSAFDSLHHLVLPGGYFLFLGVPRFLKESPNIPGFRPIHYDAKNNYLLYDRPF